MRTRAILAVLLLVALATMMAAANDSVERLHSFDASGIERLTVEHGVGSILLVPADGGNIEVELRIEPQQNGGWFRRTPDVSDMDLESRMRGDRLTLSFKEKNVSSHWVIRLPALRELSMNTGVGEVSGRLPPMAATVHVGVGSVHLEAERATAGAIDLSAGVGDTRITGGAETEQRRAFVSSESSGRGDGENAIWIKVGVGDAAVQLR
jgi:hypothetical protein